MRERKEEIDISAEETLPGCFYVENESYIEVRDCFIKRLTVEKMKKVEEELKETDTETPPMEDICFMLNYEGYGGKKEVIKSDEIISVLSLQSTTI